ncbi:hypothetical protein DFH08DRAFT_819344 [Mycena albidolilacea]|uniref:Uncharacterized protein n=1 Tax=Mycena albidolilacea TaxID=1033008 RepID=A0AAD7EFE4_9AGAR|nr:hypothetical protein DFH08DRAFT_819344 [Mycena albidolilacea]
MFETPLSENWVIGICSLLRLTHLSFNTDGVGLFAGETEIRYILANSQSLKALILIFADDLALEDADEYQDYEYFCDDPRSVVTVGATWDDWERCNGRRRLLDQGRKIHTEAAIRRNQRVIFGTHEIRGVNLRLRTTFRLTTFISAVRW